MLDSAADAHPEVPAISSLLSTGRIVWGTGLALHTHWHS